MSTQAVELILWEILENAKKFHPQQSPQIEVQVFLISSREITLQIIDNGLTLSTKQLAQLWNPYYQADKYGSGQIKGMGLGLALVATLVREAGGTYRAYNRTGSSGIVVELGLPSLASLE